MEQSKLMKAEEIRCLLLNGSISGFVGTRSRMSYSTHDRRTTVEILAFIEQQTPLFRSFSIS